MTQIQMLCWPTPALPLKFGHSKGIGVVVMLHDIKMAARFCDQTFALQSGPPIARVSHGNIITPTSSRVSIRSRHLRMNEEEEQCA